MKYLLVCLLMLLAVPAAAQVSTSKTVTITITAPAGVCTASPPAPAVAAGFTTQALCSDWTVTMPANWMGGCATAGNGAPVNSGDQSGHNWWLNPWFSNTYQPCIATQVTDPALGGKVLDLSWVTDSNAYNVGTELQSTAWFSTGTPNSGISFPNSAYYEMTFRLAPISKGTWGGIFTWPVLAQTDSSKEGIENDVIEMDVGQLNLMDAAIHNWPLSGPPGQFIWQGYGANNGGIGIGVPLSFDPTVYHTFGLITTSDGVSAYQTCTFTDGVTNSCASQPIPGGWPVGAEATLRYMLMMINACDFWNGTCNPNGTLQHMYVKDVKVWSCPSWATTQCNQPPAPTTINATDFCAANGGGNGSSGSPWRFNCIQAAVNAAQAGNTVFLAGGNWKLDTGDATYITINKPINLVGAGSGNTFDSYGHINNLTGASQCPTAGTSITCVFQTGTSYGPSDTTLTGGTIPSAGVILLGALGGQSSTCANITVSHIFFDGSQTTDGGDAAAFVSTKNCLGPITFNDIRLLTYNGTNGNAETQFAPQNTNIPHASGTCPTPGTQGINVYNSFFGEPVNNPFTNVFQSQFNYSETVQNSVFWQFVYNPIDNDCVTFVGNTTVNTAQNWQAEFGITGCFITPGLTPGTECIVNSNGAGTDGSFHYFIRNNYFNSTGEPLGVGSGINDATTNGGVSDLHYTGNWIFASIGSLDSCSWRPRIPSEDCHGAMVINAAASSSCVLSSNGNPFEITNNSIMATTSAQLNALAGSGNQILCYETGQTFGNGTPTQIKVFGFNATKNYLSSPSNQYNTDAFSISPVQTSNFCTPAAGTVSGCATSGFTQAPTVTFTLGTASGGIVPFATTNFTAQYGAVEWLASTSATTPTAGGQVGGAVWAFIPPVSLAANSGNTIFMWVMDSAGHISAPASAVVP